MGVFFYEITLSCFRLSNGEVPAKIVVDITELLKSRKSFIDGFYDIKLFLLREFCVNIEPFSD